MYMYTNFHELCSIHFKNMEEKLFYLRVVKMSENIPIMSYQIVILHPPTI